MKIITWVIRTLSLALMRLNMTLSTFRCPIFKLTHMDRPRNKFDD
jgi:hypothetical protein